MLLATLLALTVAAQPGVPEVSPRAETDVWISWGNDWFGVPGAQTDDHRTNEILAGVRRGRWVYMVDDSMLTLFDDTDTKRLHGVRMDEVTATVGYQLHDDLTIGGGLRYKGNAGGEDLQNWWHSLMNDYPVHGTYETDGLVGIGYGLWRHSFHPEEFFCPELLASATATTDGEFASDAEARLVWYTQSDATVWAGLRYQIRAGDFSTRTADATASYERGLVYEFGFMLDGVLSFQSSYIVHDKAAVGAFTYTHKL